MSVLEKLKQSAAATKQVVILSDAAFFVRVLPVPAATPPEEVPGFVELALEGLSPFSVAQLCYGYFHTPGADRALVYAAYRRRFTVADAEVWAEADAVLPGLAVCLGLAPAGPRAVLLTGAEAVTAIGWDGRNTVPAVVSVNPVGADASPEEREAAKKAAVAALGGAFPEPSVFAPPAGTVSRVGDNGCRFVIGGEPVSFENTQLDTLDVRDKAALVARRRERTRNLRLWQAAAGCTALIGLALLLQIGLAGGRILLRSRAALAEAQAPAVQKIVTKHELANRIQELSNHRLMPIRMLEIVNEKRPRTIQFTSATTRGLYGLEIQGQTNATLDISSYQAALKELPACDHVDLGQTADRGGVTRFTLTVTFRPEALRPPPSS